MIYCEIIYELWIFIIDSISLVKAREPALTKNVEHNLKLIQKEENTEEDYIFIKIT